MMWSKHLNLLSRSDQDIPIDLGETHDILSYVLHSKFTSRKRRCMHICLDLLSRREALRPVDMTILSLVKKKARVIKSYDSTEFSTLPC